MENFVVEGGFRGKTPALEKNVTTQSFWDKMFEVDDRNVVIKLDELVPQISSVSTLLSIFCTGST